MQIIQNVPAPAEAIEIARREFDGTGLSIVFDVFLNLKNDWRMGETNPDLQCVFIDLEACAREHALVRKGCTYTASTWFNILYTIFHEAAHAHQLIKHPEKIAQLDVHTAEILDAAAHKQALDKLCNWAEHGSIPELTRWGWLGLRLRELLNALYASNPQDISDEVDCIGTSACAYADAVVHIYPNFENQSIQSLFEEIDRGEFGAIINGRRFLNAYEFLAVHCESY
jgi:hypothetical protein